MIVRHMSLAIKKKVAMTRVAVVTAKTAGPRSGMSAVVRTRSVIMDNKAAISPREVCKDTPEFYVDTFDRSAMFLS